jgi:SAM domain (Sterile alpha motif)
MQPIVQWLEALGLGQYGDAFVRADIDPAVLVDLTTEADLTLGHRKRLSRAITALSGPNGTQRGVAAPGTAAERRQLTVVFSDLVGSTALTSQLDPEDLPEGTERAYINLARLGASEVLGAADRDRLCNTAAQGSDGRQGGARRVADSPPINGGNSPCLTSMSCKRTVRRPRSQT